jgi:hypothetical protein
LRKPEDIERMREVSAKEREAYTLEQMVENFTEGISKVIMLGDDNV